MPMTPWAARHSQSHSQDNLKADITMASETGEFHRSAYRTYPNPTLKGITMGDGIDLFRIRPIDVRSVYRFEQVTKSDHARVMEEQSSSSMGVFIPCICKLKPSL